VTLGTNVLVGGDMTRLCREVELVLDGRRARGSIPPLWDGHAGSRIASTLAAAGRV
jgi:UDP-N-acetylglucosamine 2-epimerase (non-hydrolysing)